MFSIGNGEKNRLIDEHTENKYYDANYTMDINNKTDSKALIANRIEKNSICLDVGCGVGYLGEMLLKYKNTNTYGIELDKKAIRCAREKNKYVDLYNFSITERKGKEFDRFIKANKKFDYIIFADLLEHVISPDDILLFFSKFLKPKGKILVSLPNVAHFDIVRGLANGNFNYNHVGLLDNTHLRFYTKRSFKQLIEQINEVFDQNFVVKMIDRTVIIPNYIDNYPNLYKILNQDDEACVLQFIYEISIDKKAKVKKENEAKDRFAEIEEVLRQKEELEKEVKELRSSTSWKITKPIRKVSAVIKRLK